MGKHTGIEWTDSTWNPIRGCSRVSEGCRNCYAEIVAARFSGAGRPYEGLAEFKGGNAHWTGEMRLIEKHLEDPLHWKEPKKIFVNSMSDLFHPGVKDEWLAAIFDVMARAKQHTYQILTKRPERMLATLMALGIDSVARAFENTYGQKWAPPNWWFGVSVEDQETANQRLPILAECPAAVRFVSYEPAIGPVNFFQALGGDPMLILALDWIICGGESGPHARPMHPAWPRKVQQVCATHGIPFFFKQWGEWMPDKPEYTPLKNQRACVGNCWPEDGGTQASVIRLGKHAAGAHLDGVEWKEFPQC